MRKTALLLMLLLTAWYAGGQTGAFLAIECQENVKLPWGLYNLSVVDGRLYGCSEGMMMTEMQAGDYVWAMEPDTLLSRMHDGLQYVVRNPRDGRLYFCVTTEGSSRLYVRVKDKGWLGRKNKPVRLQGWTGDINHPTFSIDGNMMVFSSPGNGAFGGYDLWCSRWNGKEWGKPVNMGSRINSVGNEIHPTFYYDYLLYVSDSLGGGHGYSIYAAHVRPDASCDEIIFEKYIIQRLPEPINSTADDWEMAFDTVGGCGYWISTRNGQEELFRFKGRLDGAMIMGRVTGVDGTPLEGASVTATHEGRKMDAALTRADGSYYLFVQPDEMYTINVEKPDYFKNSFPFESSRTDSNALITEVHRDVRLASLALNTPLPLTSAMFGSNTGTDLTLDGMSALTPIINFLRDNPTVEAHFTLVCDQTTDKEFNIMLTEQRLNSLHMYVTSLLPSDTPIFIHNGTEMEKNAPEASKENKLTVVLKHSK